MQHLRGKSASELGRAIGAGQVDPVDLTEDFLSAIESSPFAARIYARTTPDRARAEARAAGERARLGQRRSLLDGVPIGWKDNIDSAGVATEAGTALLEGRMPARDAVVLRNATAQGLVCLGKTHMTELAFSGLGVNPVTATPPNIHDADMAPGGSSSGAASSTAHGLASAGIGSDTGGSVRLPAAWNDLVGFKPTHNALSTDGVVPLAARFDTVGPLAQSVEDAANLFAALRGSSAPDLRGASMSGARLLVLETVACEELRQAPARAFEAAVASLEKAGAHAERAAIPAVAEALAMAGILYTSECYGTWGAAIEAAPDKMYAPVRERFEAGKTHGAADFVAAWQRLGALARDFAAAVAGFDAVIFPSVPTTPPATADLLADATRFASENILALRNTRIGNMMRLCSITLPTGQPSCGIMFNALAGHDRRLLRLAAAAEAALP
ncbi:MAG: amidase [Alphaproteobacteria bacterium]|jgi:aspartyl-tRNA(Asn)/glutamyl-tRNA(Gln) amidotransferase subunit A|nr:amidase [Alphaproteobacteria bacterium]